MEIYQYDKRWKYFREQIKRQNLNQFLQKYISSYLYFIYIGVQDALYSIVPPILQ